MKESIKIFTCCFLFLSFYMMETGCKRKETTKQTNVVNRSTTQKYAMPKSFEIFYPTSKAGVIDSATLMKAPYKLIVGIDFSCPVCIAEVDKWNDFYADSLKKYQIPLILLCQSDDKYRYMKYLFKTKKLKEFPFPLILDFNNEELKINPNLISETGKVKTVLIDADAQILYAGVPLAGGNDKQDLIKAIESTNPAQINHVK